MKGILVGVQYPQMTYDFDISMQELKQLAYACDIEVKAVVTQNLDTISPQYYIGKGKVMEIKELVEQDDIVIFNEELTPLQIKNLTDQCQVEVTDRSDLILRIFASRAKTKEAKLEVGIARLQYLLPRLAGMKQNLYSQQGGMGFRGSGEKQIELDRRRIRRQLTQAKRELAMIEKQRQTQKQLRKHHQEKVVCLVGYTNSGKSSLLNALLEEDKAIVTDIAGTTRDIVEGTVRLDGITLNLIDTAGIHESNDIVEKIGIDKSLQALEKAELVIVVIDGSEALTDEDHKLLEMTKNKNRIVVYNKNDKAIQHDGISISAINGDVEALTNAIKEKYEKELYLASSDTLNNERKIGIAIQPEQSMKNAIRTLEDGMELDLVTIDLQNAWTSLKEITGKAGKEDLLDEIFSRFCLGK